MQSLRTARTANALRGASRRRHALVSTESTAVGIRLTASASQRSRFIQTTAPAFQHGCQHRPVVSAAPSSRLQARHASSSPASTTPLGKTPLYDLHLAHGAKMVPFGGFHMPVQYAAQSVSQSHLFTRTQASIFDVSHMVQRVFEGPGVVGFLQRLTPSDLGALDPHSGTLSVLLHSDGSGGIVDDTIITKLNDETFQIVTNAACRDKDDKYFQEQLVQWHSEAGHEHLEVTQEVLQGWGLVALQGPNAEAILRSALVENSELELKGLFFGQSARTLLKKAGGGSSSVFISRGGYTGEDGFEISISPTDTVAVTETLLAAGPEKVQLAGLGARDSLRLEVGMCLYGHDLDDNTTPVEAGLSWIIPKSRRSADAGYYGAERISQQLIPRSKGGLGVNFRRVGLLVEGAPAREGAEIVLRDDADGASIGRVTSGCPSPTLSKNIAMGYIKDGLHKSGTEVSVVVRGKKRNAVVTKMPFVPTKYWKGS